MSNYGRANDSQRVDFYDAHEWALDKTVTPHTLAYGCMGKDHDAATHGWRYLRVSSSGAISNDNAANFRVSSLQPQYTYRYVSAASSTNVKNGVGLLHSIVICDQSAKSIYLYDSVSHGNNQIGYLDAPAGGTYTFDCALSAGLTLSCTSATNITVNYL